MLWMSYGVIGIAVDYAAYVIAALQQTELKSQPPQSPGVLQCIYYFELTGSCFPWLQLCTAVYSIV